MELSDKFVRATITSRTDHGPDLWSVTIKPEGAFSFRAGQYATLGVLRGQEVVERPYSIVSAPHEQELEFFFELVPHGELTPLLHKLQPGDSLLMRKSAKGLFSLDRKSGRSNHLLICTVTGIAPFVSYIRNLRQEEKDGLAHNYRLFVLHGASHAHELVYREELEALQRELPWLTYVCTISRPRDNAGWCGERGRVDDLIRKYHDLWELAAHNTTAYLCGNPTMIENGKGILGRVGFEKQGLKEEVYWIPAKASSTAAV